jgi:MYXO-CTERM domain-containing protein
MSARWRALSCLGVVGLLGWTQAAEAAPTLPGALENPLTPAEDCAMCHSFSNSPATKDEPLVAPIAWQGTLMANSARDPVFWAGVQVAHQDAPGETIACVRCHAPRAFLAGRGEAITLAELTADDRSGVDCVLCHRMIEDEEAAVGDAHFTLDDVLGIDGKVPMRGPWSYPPGEEPLHSWAPGDALADSRHCGTCHDVTTPRERVDADGVAMGTLFNEQRTYSEWRNSAYGPEGDDPKSCQDCHMPAVADVAGCGKYAAEGLLHATGGRRHDLAGANLGMIAALKALYGDAGTKEVADVFFEIAQKNTEATLAAAATLEVTAPAAVDLSVGVPELAVRVVNNTGHKLPSGYSEGRVMWLEVIARYGEEIVYSSGRWTPGVGPEEDPQLRTYEGIAVDHADQESFHLLRNNQWVIDTRIPAKGQRPDVETDPVGERYLNKKTPEGEWPHWDDVLYSFGPASVNDATPGDPGDDSLNVEVRLLYLINTPDYLEFLVEEDQSGMAGVAAKAAYEAIGGPEPVVLASSVVLVPVTGLMSGESDDGGEATSDGGTSSGTSESTSAGVTGEPLTTEGGSATISGGEDVETGGCGCSSSGGGGGSLLGIVLAALARRRRRARYAQ